MKRTAPLHLGLIFSRNVSLAAWVSTGLFDREKRIYEEHLEQGQVAAVTWFTYGADDRHLRDRLIADGRLHPGIAVCTMPALFSRIPGGSWVYSVLLPWIHLTRLRRCSVLKTNQMDGAWAGCLAHQLTHRPLFLRTGYTWSAQRAGWKRRLVTWVERWCVGRCSLASVSTTDQRGLLAPGRAQRILVLPNYIDTLSFIPQIQRLHVTPTGEYRRAVAIGRLDVQKNLPATIAGLRSVGWGLDLVGSGPLEAEIRVLAAGDGPPVRLLGTVSNGRLPDVLHQYPLYVLCSHAEGLPKTLLEAMACGVRCVGTPVAGINGLIIDGVTGFLARDTSAEAIGEAVTRAISGPDTGPAARRLVEQQFALPAIARREWRMLQHLVGTRRRVAPALQHPRVSVLLCVRNGLPFLPVAVESILRQTLTDFELVVIDDGSIDGTPAWLDACALSDHRVRVFHQANTGLTRALNAGLQHCRGPYVARMDADDLAHPCRLALQATWLDQHLDHVLLGSAYHEIDEHGTARGPSRVAFATLDADIRRLLGRLNPFFHSAVMFRRESVLRLGGYDPTFRLAQDYDLWVRLARCGRVANLPLVLAWRRFSPEMLSIRSRRRQLWHGLRSRSRWLARSAPTLVDVVAALRDVAQVALPQSLSTALRRLLRVG